MLIEKGLELMLFGMGTVFVFLALLVLCTSQMSSLLQKYLPEEALAEKKSGKRSPGSTAGVDAGTVAAISAAMHLHRAKNDARKNNAPKNSRKNI